MLSKNFSTWTKYQQTIRFFRMNDEQTFVGNFNVLMKSYEITPERTALYTSNQNGKTERSEKILIIRARKLRIKSHFSADLWSEIYKLVDYISNRTPRKSLEWKTPHEALFQKKLSLSHLHVYECRAYSLNPKIFNLNKLEPRTKIDYFVGLDFINIFQIWVRSRKRVIRTKNVIFNHSKFYDSNELDLGWPSGKIE